MLCKTKQDFNDFKNFIENINKQYDALIEQYNLVNTYFQNQGELDILNKIKPKLIELQTESKQIFTLFSMGCSSTLWEERYYDIKNDYDTLRRASPQSILQSPTSAFIMPSPKNKPNQAVLPAPPPNHAVLPAPPQNQSPTSAFTSIAFKPPASPQNQVDTSQELLDLVKIVSEKLIQMNIIEQTNAHHLDKPQFRFLFDIINAIISKSNFAKGLYDEDDLNFIPSKVNSESRKKKIKYLWKIFTCVSRCNSNFLVDLTRINKILEGKDSLYANQFLIELLKCMDKPLDQNIVSQVKEEGLRIAEGGKKEKTKRKKRRTKITNTYKR
jgi:hypothetical protein